MATGLTKNETADLQAVLKRLEACDRPGYLPGGTRLELHNVTAAIRKRLNPPPVTALLTDAGRVLNALEPTFIEIDSRPAVAP